MLNNVRLMFDLRKTIFGGPLALLLGIAALVVLFGDDGVGGHGSAELAAAALPSTHAEAVAGPKPSLLADAPGAGAAGRSATEATLPSGPSRHKKRHLGPPPSPSAAEGEITDQTTAEAAEEAPAPPTSGPLPPASAGSNGSYTPHASGKKVTLENIGALQRREEEGLAISFNSIALAPPGAPNRVKRVIAAANEIVGTPYIWGGGHGSWHSVGYDCSGAVSYALAGGGFLAAPLASTALESWGAPGPGRWITVYANAEHAYAVIDGLRWDTVGDAAGSGPRWHPLTANASGLTGFVERHPPGY
jgi:cell wall-associated NlpC family hydrolase